MSILQVKKLVKKYGEHTAVNDISFEVEKGQVFGLLGPNGAGKSTTISMISTLFAQNSGQILFNGKDIREDLKGFKQKLGVVPQDIALYPTLSGRENLMFWGHAYGLRGQALNKRIDAVSEIIGIKERLKDRIEDYSGGMKRRINIGAALPHEPELVIMDEPTVGIDPQSRNYILESVKALNRSGLAVMYTSHYMEEVEYLCDKIVIMDHGKVIASGHKNELKESLDTGSGYKLGLKKFNQNAISHIKKAGFDCEYLEDQMQLRLVSQNGNLSIINVIETMEQAGLSGDIISIEEEKHDLETVFLHLTGRSLRD